MADFWTGFLYGVLGVMFIGLIGFYYNWYVELKTELNIDNYKLKQYFHGDVTLIKNIGWKPVKVQNFMYSIGKLEHTPSRELVKYIDKLNLEHANTILEPFRLMEIKNALNIKEVHTIDMMYTDKKDRFAQLLVIMKIDKLILLL